MKPGEKRIIVEDRVPYSEINQIQILKGLRNAKQAHVLETNKGIYDVVVEDIIITEFATDFRVVFVLREFEELYFPKFKFTRVRNNEELDITKFIFHAEIETQSAQVIPIAILQISNLQDINAQLLKFDDKIYYYGGFENFILKAILDIDSIENKGSKTDESKEIRCTLTSARRLLTTKQIAEKIFPDTTSIYDIITSPDGLLKDTGLSDAGVSTDLQTRFLTEDFIFYAAETKSEIALRLTEEIFNQLGEKWIFYTGSIEDIFYFQPDLPQTEFDIKYVWGENIISKSFINLKGNLKTWVLAYGAELVTTHDSTTTEIIHDETGLIFEPHCLRYTSDLNLYGVATNSAAQGIIFWILGNVYEQLYFDALHSKYNCVFNFGDYLLIGHSDGILTVDTRAFTLGGEEIISKAVEDWHISQLENLMIAIDKGNIPHILFRQLTAPNNLRYANKLEGIWETYPIPWQGARISLVYESTQDKLYCSIIRPFGIGTGRLDIISKGAKGIIWDLEYTGVDISTLYLTLGDRKLFTRLKIDSSQLKRKHVFFKRDLFPVEYNVEHQYFDGAIWKTLDPDIGFLGDITLDKQTFNTDGYIHGIGCKELPNKVVYKFFSPVSELWGNESTIETVYAILCAITNDNTGRIHVAYFDDDNNQIKYAYSDNTINWTVQVVKTAAGATIESELYIQVSSIGQSFISYRKDRTSANIKIFYTDGVTWFEENITTFPDEGCGAHFVIDSEDLLNFAFHKRVYDNEIELFIFPVIYLKWKETVPLEVLTGVNIVDFAKYENQYVAISSAGNIYATTTPLLNGSWSDLGNFFITGNSIETDEFGVYYAIGTDIVKYSFFPLTSSSVFIDFIINTGFTFKTIKKIVNTLYAIDNNAKVFSWSDNQYFKTETNANHSMTGALNAVDSTMNSIIVAWDSYKLQRQILQPESEIWNFEINLPNTNEVKEMIFVSEDAFLTVQNSKVTFLNISTPNGIVNIAAVARDLTKIFQFGKLWDIAINTSLDSQNETREFAIDLLLKRNIEDRGGQISVPFSENQSVKEIISVEAGADSGFYPIYRIRDNIDVQTGIVVTIDLARNKPTYYEIFRSAVNQFEIPGTQRTNYQMKGRMDLTTEYPLRFGDDVRIYYDNGDMIFEDGFGKSVSLQELVSAHRPKWIARVDITPTLFSQWQVRDLSAYVSQYATVAILLLMRDLSPSAQYLGLRVAGSTEDNRSRQTGYYFKIAEVEMNVDKEIEVYADSINQQFWLIGYYESIQ